MNLAGAFFEWAHKTPQRPALLFPDRQVSYGSLAARALSFSQLLAADGAVGVLAHKSETAYAAVLGILAAGSAYVPLNPAFPPARNAYIAGKAELRTLIVGPECADALSGLLSATTARFRILSYAHEPHLQQLVAAHPERLQWEQTTAPSASVKPVAADALAYVLFTSGSTGQPKGVCVRHRNVLSYVRNFLASYAIAPEDRTTQTFDLTFDLSVHDMFVTWAAGASLVVFPNEVLAEPLPYTRAQAVSVWFSVPSVAATLTALRQAEPGALPDVRLSLFCGEKLTWNTLQSWREIAPRSRIVNLYGPTETTIAITHFEVPQDFPEHAALRGVIPIGRPLPGQHVELRAPSGAACKVDEPGALYLSGDQVSAGYLGEPQLTAASFDAGWYRTGDVGVRDEAGHLQFLGRDDAQVKIMGYRVELGEVEHALQQVSGAAHAVAGVTVRDGADELYAVLPEALAGRKREIRDALRARLPSYMQPRRYYFVEQFPRNASGKLDRRAVQELVLSPRADAPR